MSQSLLVKKTTVPVSSVQTLAKKIQDVLTGAQKNARRAVGKIETRAYWQVGRLIAQDILRNKDRAGYGERLLTDLAKSLGLSKSLLYQTLQFYRQNPIFQTSGKLTWSHQLALLQVEDSGQKKRLEHTAETLDWPVSRLEREIQKSGPSSRPKLSAPRPAFFKPRRGTLHAWLVRLPTKNSETPEIDLGFYTFKALSEAERSRFKEGSIVERVSGRLAKSNAAKNELYTYEAKLERVVDGDTLWVKLELGFGISVRKKLRLRGIDCPEMNTPAGKRAKKFAEDFFSAGGSASILVTTSKPDKYDRYLSDIWLEEKNLNLLLLQNGLAKLKTSYAERDWKI